MLPFNEGVAPAGSETGGAAGHAISASPPVNQGSCITPTENTERPLTTNKELDHDWDSRNIHMLGKKHAVFQVCEKSYTASALASCLCNT